MSLTTKLILGFAFALLLQVLQMLLSVHYTNQMQTVVQGVTESVRAGQIATRALDSASLLRTSLTQLGRAAQPHQALDVVNVYREDIREQRQLLNSIPSIGAVARDGLAKVDSALAEAASEFANLSTEVRRQPFDREATSDACAFLDDHIGLVVEGFDKLRIDLRREIDAGLALERTVHDLPMQAGITITAIGALLLGIFTVWYSRQVARPIREAHARLESEVARRTEDLTRTVAQLEDEMKERSRLQRELIDASRQAGKAELATGVLHNVGNALNSVVVSLQILQDVTNKSKRPLLTRSAKLLDEHREDMARFLLEDKRGIMVMDLIGELAIQLERESDTARIEMENLADHIQHIRMIVSSQQDQATMVGVTEDIDLRDLVSEVLERVKCNATLALDIDALPCTQIDRSRTMQILTNLIRNADAALGELDQEDAKISIRLHLDGDSFEISIADNGPGIASEHLSRIFAHGFTTKLDGHGFGLHHSANAATEMGGKLTAESTSAGATFRLRLPFRPAIALAAPD